MVLFQLCGLIGFSLIVAGVAFALHRALRRYVLAVILTCASTVGPLALLRARNTADPWGAEDAVVFTVFVAVAAGISVVVGIPQWRSRRKAREATAQGFDVLPVQR